MNEIVINKHNCVYDAKSNGYIKFAYTQRLAAIARSQNIGKIYRRNIS